MGLVVLILALSSESAESCARRCWCIATSDQMGILAQRGLGEGGGRKMQWLEGRRGAGYGGTAARHHGRSIVAKEVVGGGERELKGRKKIARKFLHRN